MDIQQIRTFLGKDWENMQQTMLTALDSDIDLLNNVNGSILANSGKQMRPALALLIARACAGCANQDSYHFAAAAELLHNATLLHDDVADDSDERRGKPTIKSLMGPSVSVLLGDFWLVRAMNLILSSPSGGGEVMRYFSRTLGDLSEGEMLQLQKAQTGDTTEEDYLRIIFSKTASLFEVAAVSAAKSVHASAQVEAAVRKYAVSLGIAFQIRDDIFDYSNGLDVGKPQGVDILEQKITMPLLSALKNASVQEQQHIRNLVRGILDHPEYREEIVDFVIRNKGVEDAQERLSEYISDAVQSLEILPDTEERRLLVALAEYVGSRNS